VGRRWLVGGWGGSRARVLCAMGVLVERHVVV